MCSTYYIALGSSERNHRGDQIVRVIFAAQKSGPNTQVENPARKSWLVSFYIIPVLRNCHFCKENCWRTGKQCDILKVSFCFRLESKNEEKFRIFGRSDFKFNNTFRSDLVTINGVWQTSPTAAKNSTKKS